MAVRLLHISGSLKGREDKLNQNIIRLGRKPDNDVVFSDNIVSGHHAEIQIDSRQITIVDLDSSNGTYINQKRVRKEKVHHNDRIQLGAEGPVFELRFDKHPQADVPAIRPLSGEWEGGRNRIEITEERVILGRGQDSSIVVGRVHGSPVSTNHAEIRVRRGIYEIEDLGSTNGTFVNGERVRATQLHNGDRVQLGPGGPEFEFCCSQPRQERRNRHFSEKDQLFRKLKQAERGGPAGERTMLYLRAAQEYYKRRRWPLLLLLGIALVAAIAISVALYQKHRQLQEVRQLAEEAFYRIRALEAKIVGQREAMSREQLLDLSNERSRFEKVYDEYLERLGVYRGKSPVEQAIMRLARRLGETDMLIPPDFQEAVLLYVEDWRRNAGLRPALDRARNRGLAKSIREALDQFNLPRELLFIALQESAFDSRAVGPPTRFGFAKGMWQFIPPTAVQYKLDLGPLKDAAQFDPLDQRHDEIRSTHAAARYLADLYSSKAAASGLLVIASYNFGETRIIEKLDQLPNDPRQRNFWNFYRNGWVPEETRKYVMRIFSAALICDKPHLFNFNMEPVSSIW